MLTFFRFDYEVEVPVPNEPQRKEILKCQLSHVKHNVIESEITDIAYKAQGFVGADLLAVVMRSVTETSINNEEYVSYKHLCTAINQVKPSAIKEVLVQVPNVRLF